MLRTAASRRWKPFGTIITSGSPKDSSFFMPAPSSAMALWRRRPPPGRLAPIDLLYEPWPVHQVG